MKFEHLDDVGERYRPHKFGNGYRTVDPRWVATGTDKFSEANSDHVLLDHLRRGFHLWMLSDAGERKLVRPSAITINFATRRPSSTDSDY
jgi:hypothetical protein